MNKNIVDCIVLGAGVSGLYLGYLLKKARKSSVLILEANNDAGRKLTLAGGGYGNLTNKNIDSSKYYGQDVSFCNYALKKFPYKKALDLFYELDIPLEERDFGQIFSLIPAHKIADRLSYGLSIEYNCEIYKVEKIQHNSKEIFQIHTSKGFYYAHKLIIATGSSAYPQINASDIGLKIAKSFSLSVKPFEPALTPILLEKKSNLLSLSGISLDVGITLQNKKLIRPLLFTHTGLSGPAILLLSLYHSVNDKIIIDFLPQISCIELCHEVSHGKLLLKNLLSRYLPDRLIYALVSEEILNKKVAELSKKQRQELFEAINKRLFENIEFASFVKAEAAKNGILTHQFDEKTMEAKSVENLFAIGEVLDITGQLGGYNIHFALASAHVLAQKLLKNNV